MITMRKPKGKTHIAYIVVTFAFLVTDDDILNTFSEIVCNNKSDQQKLAL